MKIRKAVITAAGPNQRSLPLQTLIDRDGVEKPVLRIIIEEALRAGIEEIAVVVSPGDEAPYASVAGDHAGRLRMIPQPEPLGYGHAVLCAREFVKQDPFLHLVGDHLYISRTAEGCAQQLVDVAEAQACAVSAVQATRENLLSRYGAVGGQRVAGSPGSLPDRDGRGKADAHRGRAAPGGSGPARRALPLLLRNACPHACRDGFSGTAREPFGGACRARQTLRSTWPWSAPTTATISACAMACYMRKWHWR